MNGFFERYGRMIIVAVVVCFVLLLFTPMKRTIGDNINGFVDGFANKVGDSLGTVNMPDGSDNIAKEKSSTIIGTVWDKESQEDDAQFAKAIPEQATAVVFTDEVAPKGATTTDLTVVKDGDVVGWLDGTTWKVSTQNSNKVVNFNENSSKMFYQKRSLTNIEFNNVDTSNVTDMGDMFYNCQDLTSLDLSSFDTSNVTNMRNMFFAWGRPELTSLDLSSFNTSKVTDMEDMFGCCSNLQTIKARSQTDIDKLKTKSTKVDSSVKFEIA